MNAFYKSMLVIVTLVATVMSTQADAGCVSKCCPKCDHVCKFEAEVGETEKSCFEVESKQICIPRVVFPWQQRSKGGTCASCDSCCGRGGGCSKCSCVNNGAVIREVHVLKKKKYKCPECKYSWTAEKKGCGSRCGGGCATASYATDYAPTAPPAPDEHALAPEHSGAPPTPQPMADTEWAPVQVESIPPAPTQ